MSTYVLPCLLGVALLAWLRFAVALSKINALPDLARMSDAAPVSGAWPKVSVVVACRNEAANLRPALSSLLEQDYPALEVVAVDDRSEDETGRILDALANGPPAGPADAGHPRLRVVHLAELPDGWLGKTHALARGAEAATGDLLLFTDADVAFDPGALRRAVAWMQREGLGHAVALPEFVAPGLFERAFISLFGMFLLIHLELHDLGRAGTKAHVGIGAFNLVRRDAYEAIGGHRPLRLEIADDVKLGLLLRRSGVRQGCAHSGGLVRVRWQEGFFATMRGLLKNFFAGAEYRWRDLVPTVFGVPFLTLLPVVAAVLPVAVGTRVLAALVYGLAAALVGASGRRIAAGRGYEGVLLPVAGLGLAAVAVASAVVATARGGVVWRGTRYSLRDLRTHGVRSADFPPDRAPGA